MEGRLGWFRVSLGCWLRVVQGEFWICLLAVGWFKVVQGLVEGPVRVRLVSA